MSTDKRFAIVTGGNRGIGLEICRQLASRGLDVLLTSRDRAKGQRACDQLAAEGLSTSTYPLEVTSADDIRQLAEHIQAEHGGLDALVNNAGIALDGFDGEKARKTIDTNFLAAMNLTDALLPLMRPNGRIVMVSSGLGDRSNLSAPLAARFRDDTMARDELTKLMNQFVDDVVAGKHAEEGWPSSAYSVSKVGMTKLGQIIAQELEAGGNPKGILCNSACPGWVRTDMGGSSATRSVEEGADTPVWLATLSTEDAAAGSHQGGFFRDRAPASW